MALTTSRTTLNASATTAAAAAAAEIAPEVEAMQARFEAAAEERASVGLFDVTFTLRPGSSQAAVDQFIASLLPLVDPFTVTAVEGAGRTASNTDAGWAEPGDKINVSWA